MKTQVLEPVMAAYFSKCGEQTVPAGKRHNPVGVAIFRDLFPQGSRETLQPWAMRRNRFAVMLHKIKS